MRNVILVLAGLALVVPALAEFPAVEAALPKRLGAPPAAERQSTVYDNTTTITAAFSQNPGAWIGDDLTLDLTGAPGTILDTVQFSIYNSSTSTGPLNFVDADLYFFDFTTGTLLGSLAFQSLSPVLAPGYFTTYSATGLASANIQLTSQIIAVERLSNFSGGATKAGQVLANPPSKGSSQDAFYLDNTVATPAGTSKGWFYFSGNPVANFYWSIGVVPEPASVALALASLLLVRRR